ncbi:MAG: thioredoxin family protein [Acidimicrobiales bacterium]|nr:thioredoxin family protein [Acidimicrobiales bacterium]
MRIELQYFDDCPNWKVAHERLVSLAEGVGAEVVLRQVTTPEAAEAAGFRGSPTILVDGRDPFAIGDESFGLACRVFQTPHGPAGSPTVTQLEAALRD